MGLDKNLFAEMAADYSSSPQAALYNLPKAQVYATLAVAQELRDLRVSLSLVIGAGSH